MQRNYKILLGAQKNGHGEEGEGSPQIGKKRCEKAMEQGSVNLFVNAGYRLE